MIVYKQQESTCLQNLRTLRELTWHKLYYTIYTFSFLYVEPAIFKLYFFSKSFVCDSWYNFPVWLDYFIVPK